MNRFTCRGVDELQLQRPCETEVFEDGDLCMECYHDGIIVGYIVSAVAEYRELSGWFDAPPDSVMRAIEADAERHFAAVESERQEKIRRFGIPADLPVSCVRG